MKPRFLVAYVPAQFMWAAVALLVLSCWAHGQTTTAPAGESQSRDASGTYCGVYCLYAALQLNDRHAAFSDLIKPEYIGSYRGSTLAELQKAAEDHGLHAQPVGNLTSRELRSSPYPIILHVKSSADSKRYDHYVLCVGADEKDAFIYDPPKAIQRISFPELATRWDGVGLVVSSKPISAHAIFWPTWRLLMGIVVSAAFAAVCWHRGVSKPRRDEAEWRTPSRQPLSAIVIQCGQLMAFALLIGILYHQLANEGLLAGSSAADKIVRAHEIGFLDKLDVKAVQKAMEQKAVVIDARLPADYIAGHLAGAISIPVSAKPEERLKAVAHVPKASRIVIYCQSDKCPFAGKVASTLLREGYTNIALFPGGWVQWANHSKS
ncbi:MAG: rhodanese-like domain-containing protein [Bacillota bacterium]